MIRKSLYITILVFTCFTLTHCMTDSEQADDEIAAAADDTASAAPVTPSSGGTTDDLSGDLDDSNKTASKAAGDENSLENELDGGDDTAEQPLGDKVADEKQPDMNTEPLVDSAPIEQAPADTPAPAAPKTQITNIRYLANQAGGTVVVEANGPLSYHAHSENGNYVIDIDNAQLPGKLSHAYPMRDYSSSFANLQATQTTPDQARIVVQMKAGAAGEPIVQMEGNSLLVVPASVPTHAIADNSAGKMDGAPAASPLAAHTLDEFLTGNQRFFGKPISVQTKDADVRDVVNFIAEESGANIVMSDDVKGKVSVKVRKVPWDQVLVSIMRTKQLGYVRQGNVIRISSMKELQDESDQALKMIETQRNMAPVKVKVIPVNYANVDELAKQIPAFLSKEGKAVVDARSNTILVTDRENILEKVEHIIRSLDVQPNQVLIEGKIVEATETFSSFIGVNWGFSGSPTTISQGGGYQGSPITFQPSLGSNPMDLTNGGARLFTSGVQIGALDFFGSLNAALALEEKEGLVKVISSPRVAVMNKEKAEISQAGEQVSIATTVNAVSNDKTKQEKRTPMTLNLTVQPQITADNSVIMDVELKRQFAGAEVDTDTHARPVNTRTAKTKILVRNGQTSVIGGIYQDQETDADNGVPVLKDIPVLGWLFKSKARDKDKNELLIFLTPRILQQQVAQDPPTAAAG